MPPRTANKIPVIVYLNAPEHEELKRRADGEPLSAEARRILTRALAAPTGIVPGAVGRSGSRPGS